MTQVVVSPKYQVVIPKEVRNKLTIRKGQKLTVMTKDNIIFLMPVAPLKQYRGLLKGMNTVHIREKKDRV